MKPRTRYQKGSAALPVFALCLVMLTAGVAHFPCYLIPAPAARFFAYLSAPERTGAQVDVWERLVASLTLASAQGTAFCAKRS